jgi:hypothetical protein
MTQPLGQNQITKSQPPKEQMHGAKASPHRYRMVPVYQSAQAIRTRQNDSQEYEGTAQTRTDQITWISKDFQQDKATHRINGTNWYQCTKAQQ